MSAAEQTLPVVDVVDREVAARLLRARGRMPFGGIVHAPPFLELGRAGSFVLEEEPSKLDLDRLARYLEELADVLARHVAEDAERDARLEKLEGFVRSGRSLLAELLP